VPELTDNAVEAPEVTPAVEAPEDALIEESLVEEVSIDGMCGVY
jgi:mycofactocin precursor